MFKPTAAFVFCFPMFLVPVLSRDARLDHPPETNVSLSVSIQHPRCVFKPAGGRGPGRTFEQIRELYREDSQFRAIMDKALRVDPSQQHPAASASCWIVSQDDRFAEAAIERMLQHPLDKSGEPYYSRVWSYALAYDWLFHHPLLTQERKNRITEKIRDRIGTELDDLDGDYMALWHGRNQAANGVIIAALILAGEPGMEQQLRRATAHWLESLRAIRFSEGWPEGASYWIYNRAGPYALAADCVLTATGTEMVEDVSIREVMRTIGLWQLYQYGPNGVFEPYGDSAGSLHLGDTGWWSLTTDHYAKLSRDPALGAAGDYFRNRSPDPYGKRKYYWNVALTYDPSVRPKDASYDPAKPEDWMRTHLPQAIQFGRDSYGVAYFRGEWGDPNELFASFKAGDLLAHHDHYDVGNFTIQRGGELVPQTGFYGSYYQEHRLGYQVQTVSANSILILAPGEYSNYLKRKDEWWPWVSGGQRVISPTGFNCLSRKHFQMQRNDGPHLERATTTAWESVPGSYDYVAADITSAYNSSFYAEPGNQAKVELVTRQFLFLRPEKVFVVFDRVETTDEEFRPRFLLHSNGKPESVEEEVLFGSSENGILETSDRIFSHQQGNGYLSVEMILPLELKVYKIGGPDYCFYVESDGDPSDGFDGKNLTHGSGRRGVDRKVDQWRIEVEPKRVGRSTRFLAVLMPRLVDDSQPQPVIRLEESNSSAILLRVGERLIVVNREAEPLKGFDLPEGPSGECVVLNANADGAYRVGEAQRATASSEGVLRFSFEAVRPLRVELVEKRSASQ